MATAAAEAEAASRARRTPVLWSGWWPAVCGPPRVLPQRLSMKSFLRGKLIALSASKKKLERSHTSSLTTHLKALEKKEANSPKRSRRQEIIKLRG